MRLSLFSSLAIGLVIATLAITLVRTQRLAEDSAALQRRTMVVAETLNNRDARNHAAALTLLQQCLPVPEGYSCHLTETQLRAFFTPVDQSVLSPSSLRGDL